MITKDTLYQTVRQITPPVVLSAVKKTPFYASARKFLVERMAQKFTPSWHTLDKGELAGCELFVDSQGMAASMLAGDYDRFFVDYLKKIDLRGKVIFDIGAHIGFDTLFFAKAVGENGKVFSFEPNTTNKNRLDLIVSRNKKLAQRIKTYPIAISNKEGEEDFVFSDQVDHGTSSGSFIDSAHTLWEKSVYEREIGFKRTKVRTIPLDKLLDIGIKDTPALIKIDVEGAEYLVIDGGKELIKKSKPTLFIEIHSIFNMLKVGEDLYELNYKIELLKEESDGRCFIVATPKQ